MKKKPEVPKTIDDYIAAFPPAVQAILEQVRSTIRKAAPNAVEAIKYHIPTFELHGNLVHFAAFTSHIGFYPTPSGIAKFQKALSAYPSAKGSVQFPLDRPIPFVLIERIVEFRVKEAMARHSGKSARGNRPAT